MGRYRCQAERVRTRWTIHGRGRTATTLDGAISLSINGIRFWNHSDDWRIRPRNLFSLDLLFARYTPVHGALRWTHTTALDFVWRASLHLQINGRRHHNSSSTSAESACVQVQEMTGTGETHIKRTRDCDFIRRIRLCQAIRPRNDLGTRCPPCLALQYPRGAVQTNGPSHLRSVFAIDPQRKSCYPSQPYQAHPALPPRRRPVWLL